MAGVLFIIATITSLTGDALIPSMGGAGYLSEVAQHSTRTAVALLFSIVAAGCSVGIAVALYPVLKPHHPGLAIGSVVFRTIEGVFYVAGVVALLSVLSMARDLPPTSGSGGTLDQAVADSLVVTHDRAAVVAVMAFVVGGLLYYIAFYRSRLVPRWISGWGIAAMPVMLVACLFAIFNDQPVTHYVLLAAPIGVQEFVLAAWLIVRGIRTTATLPSSPPARLPDLPRAATK
ncbi:DUF4386 domain-containing protein [Nocardioides islandensis]|uniref:DUF4386 domain-containing protein n=1 Tax=Nocardioides islandensis TaxID=433663 RepID=A0A930YF09_9ACTN|nr:DUF4386 domain-containing protein [Nocardioides islandensis]MBF4764397.1 DUF4386 domain-containing protein [Nocardioides islandensis]